MTDTNGPEDQPETDSAPDEEETETYVLSHETDEEGNRKRVPLSEYKQSSEFRGE